MVEAGADDAAVEDHDRADGHFAGVTRARRLGERETHKFFVAHLLIVSAWPLRLRIRLR